MGELAPLRYLMGEWVRVPDQASFVWVMVLENSTLGRVSPACQKNSAAAFKRKVIIPAGVVFAALLATLVASHAIAGVTSLLLQGDPGDFIVGNQQLFFTPLDGTFGIYRNHDNGVSVYFNAPLPSGEHWGLDFAAPGNQPLTVGSYAGATRYPLQNVSQPGLDVDGDSRGCNTLTGQFEIKEVTYGSGDNIVNFWATFEQHCEGGTPAAFGEIRFNATSAPAYSTSAPFFPIKSGNSWTYQDDGACCSTITVLSGTTNVNGVATKSLRYSDGSTDYFTNDWGGIRLQREDDPSSGLTVIFSPPIKIAYPVMAIGQTVNSSGTAVTSKGNVSYTTSYTAQAFDNVTVPLRNFDVVRFEGTLTLCGASCQSASQTLYLARKVGIVQSVGSFGGSTSTAELTATNVTPANDIDADGKSDLIWRHNVTGDVDVWLMNGSTVQTNAWINRVADLGWQIVGVGDLDGDGKSDLVWRHNVTGDVDVWLMNGSTVQTNAWINRVADLGWQIQP